MDTDKIIVVGNFQEASKESYRRCSINKLSNDPKREDLKKFSKIKLKKNRFLKKFIKNPSLYIKKEIWKEYVLKLLVKPISSPLNYVELGKQLFSVEPMDKPEGLVATMTLEKVCPECGGHGGIYLPELGIGPDGECANMQCPTCCPSPEMEDE